MNLSAVWTHTEAYFLAVCTQYLTRLSVELYIDVCVQQTFRYTTEILLTENNSSTIAFMPRSDTWNWSQNNFSGLLTQTTPTSLLVLYLAVEALGRPWVDRFSSLLHKWGSEMLLTPPFLAMWVEKLPTAPGMEPYKVTCISEAPLCKNNWREMAHPVSTKGFLQLSTTAAMCCHAEGNTHPLPSVPPPFRLLCKQSLSPRHIHCAVLV